jgi:hypothetical protein
MRSLGDAIGHSVVNGLYGGCGCGGGGGVVVRGFHSLKIQVSSAVFSQNNKFLKVQGLHCSEPQVLQPCLKNNLNITIRAQSSKQFVFITACG